MEVQQPKIYAQWDKEFKHNQKNPRQLFGKERLDVDDILERAKVLRDKATLAGNAAFEVFEAVRELQNSHEPATQCRAWQRIAAAVQQLDDRT